MQCLEVSGAVRLIYRSLGVKGLNLVLSKIATNAYRPFSNVSVTSVRLERSFAGTDTLQ